MARLCFEQAFRLDHHAPQLGAGVEVDPAADRGEVRFDRLGAEEGAFGDLRGWSAWLRRAGLLLRRRQAPGARRNEITAGRAASSARRGVETSATSAGRRLTADGRRWPRQGGRPSEHARRALGWAAFSVVHRCRLQVGLRNQPLHDLALKCPASPARGLRALDSPQPGPLSTLTSDRIPALRATAQPCR